MTSQILSMTVQFLLPFFLSFFKSNLITLEPEKALRNGNSPLSDFLRTFRQNNKNFYVICTLRPNSYVVLLPCQTYYN